MIVRRERASMQLLLVPTQFARAALTGQFRDVVLFCYFVAGVR